MVDIVCNKENWAKMKTAKSYKIIMLFTAFVLFMAAAFCSMTFGVVETSAATPVASSYFSGAKSVEFKDDNVLVTFGKESGENEVAVKNELVIEDFAITLKASADVESLNLKLTYDSYYVNGNQKVEGEKVSFDKEIVNEIALTGAETETKYEIKVVDNKVQLNGTTVNNDLYYKIRKVDKATAKVALVATLKDGVDTATLEIVSIDQKASDTEGNYKQTFKIEDDKLTYAKVRATVGMDIFAKTETGYKTVAFFDKSESYSASVNVYSVINNVNASELYLANPVNAAFANYVEKPKKIVFNKADVTATFDLVSKEGETVTAHESYSVEIVKKDKDQTKPKLIADNLAIDAYKNAIDELIYAKDDNGNIDRTQNVALGTDFEVPSFEDLVVDDYTPYATMGITVKYSKENGSFSTASDKKFELNSATSYAYYVEFTDVNGNKIEQKDYFEINDDDEYVFTTYKNFVFQFVVNDNAPIEVSSIEPNSVGYLNATYTASKFKIDAVNCNLTYTLWFAIDDVADVDNEASWVEIPKASSVTDEDYEKDGYTYDDIKNIAYNGERTFTPNKTGVYKIVCTATSEVSSRTATATTRIEVKEAKIVVPDNHWLQNNVWSVVFLSIGTLCLIGIIVLLCIKPKEDVESDE